MKTEWDYIDVQSNDIELGYKSDNRIKNSTQYGAFCLLAALKLYHYRPIMKPSEIENSV